MERENVGVCVYGGSRRREGEQNGGGGRKDGGRAILNVWREG